MFAGWLLCIQVAPEVQTARLMVRADGLPPQQGATFWTAPNVNECIPRNSFRFISRRPSVLFLPTRIKSSHLSSEQWYRGFESLSAFGYFSSICSTVLFSVQYGGWNGVLSHIWTWVLREFCSLIRFILTFAFYFLTKSHCHFSYSLKKLRFKLLIFPYSVCLYSGVSAIGSFRAITSPLEEPFNNFVSLLCPYLLLPPINSLRALLSITVPWKRVI